MKRGWDCAGECGKTAATEVLWRMNPKGEPGVFMCGGCRARVEMEDLLASGPDAVTASFTASAGGAS